MKPREFNLRLSGRPRSTKNSREVIRVRGRVRSVMSGPAAEWMLLARAEVRRWWKGRPLQSPVHVHIHVVFANRRSLPDGDNAVLAIFDALKGIAVKDDNLKCIPSHSFSHEVAPGEPECVLVTLTCIQETP